MARPAFTIGAWLKEASTASEQLPVAGTILEFDGQVHVQISPPGKDDQKVTPVHSDNINLGLHGPKATLRISQYPQVGLGGAHIAFDILLGKAGVVLLDTIVQKGLAQFHLKLQAVVEPRTILGTSRDADRSLSLANTRVWCTIPYQALPVDTVITITVCKTDAQTGEVERLLNILQSSSADHDGDNETNGKETTDESCGAEEAFEGTPLSSASDKSKQLTPTTIGLEEFSTSCQMTNDLPADGQFCGVNPESSASQDEPWCDFTTVARRTRADAVGGGRHHRGSHRGRGGRGAYRGRQNVGAGNQARGSAPRIRDSRNGYLPLSRGRGQRLGQRSMAAVQHANMRANAQRDVSIDRWSQEVAECWGPTAEATGTHRASGVKKLEAGGAKFTPADPDAVWRFLGVSGDDTSNNGTKD